MGLVRNDHSAAYLRDAVALDLGEIAEEGRTLLENAKREANRIVTDAQQKVDQLLAAQQEEGFRKGYHEGYQEGFGKGVEQGREHAISQMASDIETTLQSWQEALNYFHSAREKLQQEAKHDVLKLAINMAEKIIYRITELDPTIIEAQLEETLHLLATKTTVKINVNPNDLETAQAILPSLLERTEHCDELALIADATIHPGGCFIHTETGDIDAQIETQVKRIVETLLPLTDKSDSLKNTSQDKNNHPNQNKTTPQPENTNTKSQTINDNKTANTTEINHESAQSALVDSFLSDMSEDNHPTKQNNENRDTNETPENPDASSTENETNKDKENGMDGGNGGGEGES